MLTKEIAKKLVGNYTRMLRVILKRTWWQHPTKQQLYGHQPSIMKTSQGRRTRYVGHCWRCRSELISDAILWTTSHGRPKQDDQLKPTYSSSVLIWDVALKTCREQWTIGRRGERGSGISVLMAWHDDDDDDLVDNTGELLSSYFYWLAHCSCPIQYTITEQITAITEVRQKHEFP